MLFNSVLSTFSRYLFDMHYLTAFAEATLRAHPMQHSRLLAIRTNGSL